jgi:hypothetical protein
MLVRHRNTHVYLSEETSMIQTYNKHGGGGTVNNPKYLIQTYSNTK